MPYKDRRALDRSPDNKLHLKKLFFDPVIYFCNQLERFEQLL